MPEPLKNLYTPELIASLAKDISSTYPGFNSIAFQKEIFCSNWNQKELKERMLHITVTLHQFLPKNFLEALKILKAVSKNFNGFQYMFFPAYIGMFGMEYFDDPSELAEYDSQEDAIAAVEEGLAQGRGGATKVYRIDIPGKDETVFGVALNDSGCSGDEYIMSRIDKDTPRSTAHLPYEILVYGDEAEALYGRFRIALSWPHLPMMASETGATFMSIMCSPDGIKDALTEVAGGEAEEF